MNYSIKSKAFCVGVFGAILVFATLNIFVYFASHCHHCVRTLGFPFPIHQLFAGTLTYTPETGVRAPYDFENFYPENILINLLLIFTSSLGTGVMVDLIWIRFQTWRTELKAK